MEARVLNRAIAPTAEHVSVAVFSEMDRLGI